jgi:hypothetical protein
MSARYELYDLGRLERQNGVICVYCRRCSNRRFFYASELSHRAGIRKVIWNLQFKCTNCGYRRIDIQAYVPLNVR